MDRNARLLVVVSFLAASCSVLSSLNITSSPQLGVDTVCDNQDVTLMCHTDQTTGNITWHWSNQLQHGDTITVVARMTGVVYTCVVSNSNGEELREINVTVRANGAPPHVERIDFSNYIRKNEGSNLTLTTKISSNIPLSGGYPIWVVDFRLPLPSTAVVDNYTTTDGALYNRLLLYELSFEDDTGNYTNIVSNQCGTSSVSVFIDVRKVYCDNLTAPNNGTYSCSLGYDGVPSYKDTCNFTCNIGYELTGSDTRTCRSDGGWSGTQTMCRRIYCVNLTDPDNGAKNCSLGDDGVFSYEDTCSFTCNIGYELNGSDTRICQSDGSWSGTQTMCRRRTKTGGNHGTTNKLYMYIIIGIVVGILAIVAVTVILYCGRGRGRGRGRLKNWCSDGGSREQIGGTGYRLIMSGDEIQDESIPVPSVPTNLTAEALSHDQIKITWGPVTDNCGANEYRFVLKVTNKDTGTQECGDIQLRGDQRVTTCNGLKNSTEYRIQLAAVNCKGCSNFAEATVRTLASVPSAPTNLTAEALSQDQIKITWEPVTDNGGADVNNFVLKVIEMDTSTQAFDDRQFRGDQMEATPNGLKNNIEYKIQLAAVNRAGWSDFAEATVRTLASELQNISIGEKARQRPLVQIKDFDSVYSDLSHGAVHKWKEIGLQLDLKSYELNEISADYKDDPEENMKKVSELWKVQSLNPTWKKLIAAIEQTRLNPQLSQTLRRKHQNEIDNEVQSKDFDNDVLTSMAKYWFDFGLKLGIDEIQLNNIMPTNTETFFKKMLLKWWEKTETVAQTWNKVVSALDAVKLSGLAKIIYDSRIKQADNFLDDDI